MARHIVISDSIRQEIAARVVEQAHPGYHRQGYYYVVDGERVMYAETTRQFDPWHDDADVIGVDDLVFIFGGAEADRADFDPTSDDPDVDEETAAEIAVDFARGYVPDSYDAEVYEAYYGE